jgi:hypothetical protein
VSVVKSFSAEQLSNVKRSIVADAKGEVREGRVPSDARKSNAARIVAKTVAYTEEAANITAKFSGVDVGKSGYLNRLGKATLPKAPARTGDNVIERTRIQHSYDSAYKLGTPSQAQKSADEISDALRKALPTGVDSLGNIGEPLPANMRVHHFKDARSNLEAFAEEIVIHADCKGLYSQSEQAAVKLLVICRPIQFFQAIQDAGEKVDFNDAMRLCRDNIIKIHHQQKADHQVISGSDHGVRHVLQGNVAHALQALDRLGNCVSPKEKLMVIQIMIDHDLGYTLDAAKGDFGASKDHPLASAAYLEFGEQNSAIFTPKEQNFMRDAVLKHSYPFGLDKPLDFGPEGKENAIANLIAVIDATGVTSDTKCPAIYRKVLTPDAVMLLAIEDDDPSTLKKFLHTVIHEAFVKGRISPEVAEGYHMALDYDADQVGAKMIAPQFGGKLLRTDMEPAGDGDLKHFTLHLYFGVSQEIRELAVVVGNGDEIRAFKKMVDDLPFQPTGAELAAAEKEGEKPPRVTDLGQRAREAEAGRPQTLTTGGAVKITLTKLPLG